jgi:hypothetical protein
VIEPLWGGTIFRLDHAMSERPFLI